MSSESTKSIAEKLVALCRANDAMTALDTLYHPDAVSVEAMTMPGTPGPEIRGIPGIKGKHDWWNAAMEMHSASADGPFLHGSDRFAVIFEMDCTARETGVRTQMKEVAIYTVSDGKIVREEFYYTE